jgi:hypothetical protein
MLVCYQAFLMGGLFLLAAVAECIGRSQRSRICERIPAWCVIAMTVLCFSGERMGKT